MTKRARSSSLENDSVSHPSPKKSHSNNAAKNAYIKVATQENAAVADKHTPLSKLNNLLKNNSKVNSPKGDAVVYWMRMEDMRIADNRALSNASSKAKAQSIPLLVLFIISPQDYEAHDRSSRRIDFMLRNLSILKADLVKLNIPLYVITHKPRRTLPEKVIGLLEEWKIKGLYANIEYEVDELRRDIRLCELGREKGIECNFVHDKLIVEPDTLKTKNGRAYAVYSPWLRNWIGYVNDHADCFKEASGATANDFSIKTHKRFSSLFDSAVPKFVEGFLCADKLNMEKFWPAGTDAAREVLERFLHTKTRTEQMADASPLTKGAEESDAKSRISTYGTGRNRADLDSTSKLSPYLASGVLSARECIRAVLEFSNKKKLEANRETGVGMWVQELAWRDFYSHVLAAFPRVSMGRPYLEKFANVKWETDGKHLQAWKEGRTGVPIVDAAMRQINTMGWVHNRCRMIVAMYLTKDLMIDWRLGERYFMENLIDGDLASNNGGWQWSASTGTDPQPYFRIFNPYSQSEKADPSGDYIRHYIPELAKLKGKEIHNPTAEAADKHGYPRPLVDHKESRERALRRYKNPGEL